MKGVLKEKENIKKLYNSWQDMTIIQKCGLLRWIGHVVMMDFSDSVMSLFWYNPDGEEK